MALAGMFALFLLGTGYQLTQLRRRRLAARVVQK
jgi:hypothetical protein